MTKKKHPISKLKTVYLVLIIMLPMYAAFALQLVPTSRTEIRNDDPKLAQCLAWVCPGDEEVEVNYVGWPLEIERDPVTPYRVLALLANVTVVAGGVYTLVLLSALTRRKFFNQYADGTPVKPSKKKR